MDMSSAQKIVLVSLICSMFPVIYSWGIDGHYAVCKIAQPLLNEAAADAVKQLLPKSAENIWEVRVHGQIGLNSDITGDCKDEDGEKGRCVAGAINNYTDQLLSYRTSTFSQANQYNLTEALLFLSHFIGDIHQPLHVGFTSDRGANTIDVHWYRRKTVLHHVTTVWDNSITETSQERFYDASVDDLITAIQRNITGPWADQVPKWEKCSLNKTTCPDIYASESIKAACEWAYKDVSEDSVLEDDYFLSRYPVVNKRLAQGGVRLAATLNRIFS
ncbi:hypothetical protein C5167_005370 [Papaver somniferum]|uniref:Aspergillus nuclease S1 n=1 Tax=Papaver somniferum TaxID=3469 RepID=A0A4Y7JB83_PAPSO|nr:hypothetical protein C5167_005370 [Papaver somniferum]